jgi:cytochrome c oxidase accessory protein FixG
MKLDEITFRDSISTIDSKGERAWVYAKKPKGKYYLKRKIFGYSLLLFFIVLPFININGEQFLMLNVLERKFILFGTMFYPKDFYLFYLITVSFIVFIVLFTVLFGRLFCGWACPQTLFLELIFRPIEWLIEGKPAKQKQLDAQKLNPEKIVKKTSKYTIYFGISIFITNIFLSYIVGSKVVMSYMQEPISAHPGGFIAMMVFSFAFFFIYTRFREQVCTLMCPYGRLQSVLIDSDTVQVAYDSFRGEPRGVAKKKSQPTPEKIGDCIDCKECVRVCPTSIDIRNGSQLECINCTACMDSCNAVMRKIGKPSGLIRYSSENGLKTGKNFRFTPRNIAYSAVLIGILIFFMMLLLGRGELDATILRSRTSMFQNQNTNEITNLFTIEIMNQSNHEINVNVKLIAPQGRAEVFGSDLKLKKGESAKASILVYIQKKNLSGSSTPIKFGIFDGENIVKTVEMNFLGQ